MKSNLFEIQRVSGNPTLVSKLLEEDLDDEIEIFDNLLSEEEYRTLSQFMLGHDIPWSYSNGVNMPEDGYYQFTHVFYNNFEPQSKYFGVLSPILKQIDPVHW